MLAELELGQQGGCKSGLSLSEQPMGSFHGSWPQCNTVCLVVSSPTSHTYTYQGSPKSKHEKNDWMEEIVSHPSTSTQQFSTNSNIKQVLVGGLWPLAECLWFQARQGRSQGSLDSAKRTKRLKCAAEAVAGRDKGKATSQELLTSKSQGGDFQQKSQLFGETLIKNQS